MVENSFRDLNIAFVNELAKSFQKMDIDISEVIKGASTKPFGFLPHYPGCGVGGNCIPLDPYYLIQEAKKVGFEHELIKKAREINESMPKYTVELLIKALQKRKEEIKEAKVGVLGLAYKAGVSDDRKSPSYKIINVLKELGAKIFIFDPYLPEKSNVKTLDELLKSSDYVILCTNHREFTSMEPVKFKEYGIKIIIDGKNCLNKEEIKKQGIVYKGIGIN